MTRFLYNWMTTAQNTVLAPRCPTCAAPVEANTGLCVGCRAELPFIEAQCRHCALPLSPDAATRICPDCLRRPRFDRAIAAFHYRNPTAWLIGGLKYHGHLSHARVLGELMADRLIANEISAPDIMAAVPLHPTGFRRRGFNQAERIAARLQRRLDWPLVADAFIRTRDTARQSTLGAGDRAANVRDAFAARVDLTGQRVALIDDVMTTTRTAAALARCARRAGAREVAVYCVARA